MRLSKQYNQVIKDSFNTVFKNGEIYLFGSRTDDSQKGGDIDLYLVLQETTNLFRKKLRRGKLKYLSTSELLSQRILISW